MEIEEKYRRRALQLARLGYGRVKLLLYIVDVQVVSSHSPQLSNPTFGSCWALAASVDNVNDNKKNLNCFFIIIIS